MHRVIPFLRRVISSLTPTVQPVNVEPQLNKSTAPRLLLIAREYLDNEVRENNLASSTQKKYNTFHKNLSIFIRTKYRDREITVADVDIPMMVEFKSWLHQNLKSCSLTNSAKHIETIKRIMDYSVLMKHIPYNPISSFKAKRDKVKEVINLEPEELMRIEKAVFVCDEYYLVRDLYLFQCYTGLSYIDLWRYELEENTIREYGITKSITLVTSIGGRGKTGKKYWAELTPQAKYIHDKYKGDFPKLDNSRYNRYLKELMNHIGIKKYLTTHTGRKTFATVKDGEGYSMPTIAAMLGNTEQVARTAYVNQTKKKVLSEISELQRRKGTDMGLTTN
jgi:integrase